MDLIHIWHGDTNFSIPVHDRKVKVTHLEFVCKSFVSKLYNVSFCKDFDDLISVWHGDR